MSAILDTNLLIARHRPLVAGPTAISVASIAELHYGVLRASESSVRSVRLQVLAGVESEFDPISLSADVARAYAQCAIALQDIGRNPRPRMWDLIIAATAIVNGATLYTLNPDDFRGLEGLVEIVVPDLSDDR